MIWKVLKQLKRLKIKTLENIKLILSFQILYIKYSFSIKYPHINENMKI